MINFKVFVSTSELLRPTKPLRGGQPALRGPLLPDSARQRDQRGVAPRPRQQGARQPRPHELVRDHHRIHRVGYVGGRHRRPDRLVALQPRRRNLCKKMGFSKISKMGFTGWMTHQFDNIFSFVDIKLKV